MFAEVFGPKWLYIKICNSSRLAYFTQIIAFDSLIC